MFNVFFCDWDNSEQNVDETTSLITPRVKTMEVEVKPPKVETTWRFEIIMFTGPHMMFVSGEALKLYKYLMHVRE